MVKRKHPKSDLYRAERESGLTYKQIAEKYGVSVQCVQQACAKHSPAHYRYNNTCIYPVLRKWMNDNKCCLAELLRRMGLTTHPGNYDRLVRILSGRSELKKSDIDILLRVTGMTYEELFREDEDGR